MVELTTRQIEYLHELDRGPRSTHDMVRSRMVTANSVTKAMKRLRALGFVRSYVIPGTRGRQYMHALVDDYDVRRSRAQTSIRNARTPITTEHLQYAAALRRGRATGQELAAKFQKKFPCKSRLAVRNIVAKAITLKLCR